MPVTGRNMSQSISWFPQGLLPGQVEVHQGCWRARGCQTPAHRRQLPAPCPADNQPGIEKPLRLAGVGHIAILNLSALSSPPETSLPSSLEVSAPTPPQSYSDYTDSATHWGIIFFRQWPVITLPAHPNLQLYSKKVKQNSRSYLKKHTNQTGRMSDSVWAVQDCRTATTNALQLINLSNNMAEFTRIPW